MWDVILLGQRLTFTCCSAQFECKFLMQSIKRGHNYFFGPVFRSEMHFCHFVCNEEPAVFPSYCELRRRENIFFLSHSLFVSHFPSRRRQVYIEDSCNICGRIRSRRFACHAFFSSSRRERRADQRAGAGSLNGSREVKSISSLVTVSSSQGS